MSITNVNERAMVLVRGGVKGPGIIFNRDPARPVFIGSDSSIAAGNPNSGSILDPRSSLYVAGDADVWVCAPAGTSPDNPVAVDYIAAGRAQHYTSPDVLTTPIGQVTAAVTAGQASTDALLPVLTQILSAIQNLNPSSPPGEASVLNGTATLSAGTAQVAATIPAGASVGLTYGDITANAGILAATSVTATGFTIESSNPSDSSPVYWTVISA